MKTLKPGKVKIRKFVCPWCGCEFAAKCTEIEEGVYVRCPQDGCGYGGLEWNNGEPYEEPKQEARPKETDEERLSKLIMFADEFYTSGDFVDYLIARGVTFKETLNADDRG